MDHEWHAKHPFAGQNKYTTQMSINVFVYVLQGLFVRGSNVGLAKNWTAVRQRSFLLQHCVYEWNEFEVGFVRAGFGFKRVGKPLKTFAPLTLPMRTCLNSVYIEILITNWNYFTESVNKLGGWDKEKFSFI